MALRTAGQESAQTYLWATVPHRDIFSIEVSPTQVTLACIKVTTKQTKKQNKNPNQNTAFGKDQRSAPRTHLGVSQLPITLAPQTLKKLN